MGNLLVIPSIFAIFAKLIQSDGQSIWISFLYSEKIVQN